MGVEDVDASSPDRTDAADDPPMWEAHEKVQVSPACHADAVLMATAMAWERQRTARPEEERP